MEIPGFSEQIRKDPDAALAKTTKKHVPLLYYTGAAWAAAFAIDVTDSELSVHQTAIEKMMRRALALDETWEMGSLHDFFISWEAGHASAGGSMEKAREHYFRAMQISAGARVSPMVSYAESVLVPEQKKKEFEKLLNEALAIDIEQDAARAEAGQRAGAAPGHVAAVAGRRAVLDASVGETAIMMSES